MPFKIKLGRIEAGFLEKIFDLCPPENNYAIVFSGSRFDRDRDTTSQDSGISQMSVGNDRNDVNGVTETDNKFIATGNNNRFYGVYLIINCIILDEEGIVKAVLECCLIDNPTPLAEKQKLLLQIKGLIEAGQVTHIIPNFK